MSKDISKLSDSELLEILVRNENSSVPGSLFQKAAVEYSIRNKQHEKNHQDKLIEITSEGMSRVIALLEFIANKPKSAAIYAGLFAITVGVAVNMLTELAFNLLHLK